MKIYTRKGDEGETSLFGGRRVPKDHIRVDAYGAVDELNSFLGLAVAGLPAEAEEWCDRLTSIQSDCFTIGALLASPPKGGRGGRRPAHIPDLDSSRVSVLEGWIDELDEELEPLESFILPGKTAAASAIHVARSVCRRAERRVVTLARESQDVDPAITAYLNRLSDLLFTLARAVNARQGEEEVIWRPER